MFEGGGLERAGQFGGDSGGLVHATVCHSRNQRTSLGVTPLLFPLCGFPGLNSGPDRFAQVLLPMELFPWPHSISSYYFTRFQIHENYKKLKQYLFS